MQRGGEARILCAGAEGEGGVGQEADPFGEESRVGAAESEAKEAVPADAGREGVGAAGRAVRRQAEASAAHRDVLLCVD